MKPRTALSFTMVSLYHQCPFKWRKQYVEKVYQPSNGVMLFGSAFHKVMEIMFTNGIFDYDELLKVWYDKFINYIQKNAWRTHPKITKSQQEFFLTQGRTFINRSLNLFKEYELLKKVPKECIEQRMTVKFRDFKITTKPDIMIPDRDGLTLLDYKSGGSEKEDHKIQTAIYKEVSKSKKYNVKRTAILYPCLKKLVYVDYDRKKAAQYVNEAYQGILADNFEPKENEYCKTCHVKLKHLCPIKTYKPRGKKNVKRVTKLSKQFKVSL